MDKLKHPDPQTSPRKRLKTVHHFGNDGMEEEHTPPTAVPMTDELTMQDSNAAPEPDKEVECGITEYVDTAVQRFTGVLKKRYTDFLVNEILPSGQVVHLNELKVSKSEPTDPAHNRIQQHPLEHANPKEKNSNVGPLSPSAVGGAQEGSSETVNQQPKNPSPTRPLAEMEPSKRQKHKVIVRQSEQGIEEITQEQSNGVSQEGGRPPPGLEPEEGAANASGNTDGDNEKVQPEIKKPPAPSTTQDWQAYAGNVEKTPEVSKGFELTAEDRDTLTSYFGPSTVCEILALHDRILKSPHRRTKDYASVKSSPITDRSIRTRIHQDLRRVFQSRLESSTDDDGTIRIVAASEKPSWNHRAPGRGNNQQHQRGKPWGRTQWQDLGGEYLHFTLCKENKDTMEAVVWLAKQLKMQPRSFQFAGTKDRRGVTVQRVSAHRVMADRMMIAGRTLRQAKVGNFQYQPHELRLGDLMGNEFVITLRDCQFSSDTPTSTESRVQKAEKIVAAAIKSLSEKGFVNYYGLQRFGTFATRTDSIGMKMLQGDFQGAVEAILAFSPSSLASASEPMTKSTSDKIASDDRARACALNAFKDTKTAYPALAELPRKFSAEASIVRHLGNRSQQNDYLGALNSIARNLRLMYVHAYQSLVWNVMAGTRWRKYGSKVVEGDLVLVHEHSGKDGAEVEQPEEEVDVDGEVILRPDASDTARNAEDAFVRARVLSKDEAESGRYSIFDIVLPTPGFDVIYPTNEIGEEYKIFMSSERGGGLDPYDMRRKWKDFSLSGSYRKLLARPEKGIDFKLRTYEREDQQFVETDLDRVQQGRKDDESKNRCDGFERPHTPLDGNSKPIEAADPVTKGSHVPNESEDNAGTEKFDGPAATDSLTDNFESEDGGVSLELATTNSPSGQDERLEEKIAVIITMQLGSSTYATMALRELMGPGGVQTYKPDFGGGR
ncbi:MAG: hypothetical protein Q9191_003394 [Dirinaria sp. TL-2023a]